MYRKRRGESYKKRVRIGLYIAERSMRGRLHSGEVWKVAGAEAWRSTRSCSRTVVMSVYCALRRSAADHRSVQKPRAVRAI